MFDYEGVVGSYPVSLSCFRKASRSSGLCKKKEEDTTLF